MFIKLTIANGIAAGQTAMLRSDTIVLVPQGAPDAGAPTEVHTPAGMIVVEESAAEIVKLIEAEEK
jgi:hypothetical protein